MLKTLYVRILKIVSKFFYIIILYMYSEKEIEQLNESLNKSNLK